jgi:hypothetical protein
MTRRQNCAQLEAHSGLGSWLDDPNHPDEEMRASPNVYNLELREELFHGVRALRLIPQDEQENVWPGWPPRSQLSAWAEWRFKWLRVYQEL